MRAWAERAVPILAAALPLAAAWLWGGLRVAWLPAFACLAATLLATLLVASGPGAAWVRDAFFWLGLAFLAFLGVQWWNAGRVLYFDVEMNCWAYSPPPHPAWPWAFRRDEAGQMLQWFFPAWTVGLALRAPCVSARAAARIVEALLWSAGLLGLLGVVQFATRTPRLLWCLPLPDDFYATFPYTNHAAAYFVLMGAVAAGLLLRRVFRRPRPQHDVRLGLLSAVLVLCLVSANLSLSRAGIVLAWALAAFVAVYSLVRGWRFLRPAAQLNLAAAVVAAVGVLYFAVSGFGSRQIREEWRVRGVPLQQAIPTLAGLNLDLGGRPELAAAAWRIWQAHPWYGAGGWGYRYLAAFHASPELRVRLKNVAGLANVHNDPLQFLAEFGTVGTGLMALMVAALAGPLFRRGVVRGAVFTLTCTGLGLIAVFSLIDLPFRCPAILWTWVALAAVLPRLCATAPSARPDFAPADT